MDHPKLVARCFPSAGRPVKPAEAQRSPEELLEVQAADGSSLHCVLAEFAPGGTGPTVLHFHGNAETAQGVGRDGGFWQKLFKRASASRVIFAEYRGYGGSGGWPTLCRMQEDLPRIVAAAGVPPEQLVVYGRSMGSVFALATAALFPAVRGLILES